MLVKIVECWLLATTADKCGKNPESIKLIIMWHWSASSDIRTLVKQYFEALVVSQMWWNV